MRLLLALFMLAGCQPEGNALTAPGAIEPPPPFGMAAFISPLVPGQQVQVDVRAATPGDTLYFVVGTTGTVCPASFGGTCADVVPSTYFSLGTVSAGGTLTASPTVPAGVPVGLTRRLQIVGGVGSVAYMSVPWDRTVAAACPGSGAACNLLANPTVRDWVEPYEATTSVLDVTWGALDHTGTPGSGSVRAENLLSGSYTSAWQCVPVTPGEVLTYEGYSYLEDRGAAGDFMFAEYIFYQGPGCTGAFAGFAETPHLSITNTWTLQAFAPFTVPAGAVSVKVGHGNGGQSPGLVAYHDDLTLLRQ